MIQKIRRYLPIILLGLLVLLPLIASADEWYVPCTGGSKADSTFNKTMDSYLSDSINGACWFCGIFETLFDAVNNLASTIYRDMAKDFTYLMGGGVLLLIMFKVLKMFVRLQEVDVMQFLDDLFKPLGRAMVATVLLGITWASAEYTPFSLITNPVLDTSLAMGHKVMEVTLSDTQYINRSGGEGGSSYSWKNLSQACMATVNKTKMDKGNAMSRYEKGMMKCWLKEVASSFIVGIGIGGSLVSAGFTAGPLDGLNMIMIGAVMWLSFYVLYLMFPFKVVDAFVRLAFVLTLMPLWIVLWVFPATVSYTKKAWDMFLSSVFLFTVLSIMIALAITLMNNAIPTSGPAGNVRQGLIQCLLAGNEEGAATWIPFGGGALLNTIAFAAMSFSLLGSAGVLANTFIPGGGDLGIGNNMFGLASRGAGVAWQGAKTTAKVGVAATGAAMAAGNAAARYLGTPANGARASKLNRFFGALGKERSVRGGIAAFGDRLKNGPKPEPTPYNPATLGQDYGSLTDGAQRNVDNSVNRDVGAIQAEFAKNGSGGLFGSKAWGKMLASAKTPEERALLNSVMKDVENKKAVDPKTLQALRDERARQAMDQNPMLNKNHKDKVDNERDKKNNKDAQDQRNRTQEHGEAAAKYAKDKAAAEVEGKTKRDSLAAILPFAKQKDIEDWKAENCKSAGERAAVDKFVEQHRNAATPEEKAAARDAFVKEWAEAKVGEPPKESEESKRYGRFASAKDEVRSDPQKTKTVEDLQTNMAFIEKQLHAASSLDELRGKLASHQWQFSGDADKRADHDAAMHNMAERLWKKKDTGDADALGYAIQSDVGDYLEKYGRIIDGAVLARDVAKTSRDDVLRGQDTAITSSLGKLLDK